MNKTTQKQCRELIRTGAAVNANELYDGNPARLMEKLGHCETVALGRGVYGMNCGIFKSARRGLVVVPNRSTALFVLA